MAESPACGCDWPAATIEATWHSDPEHSMQCARMVWFPKKLGVAPALQMRWQQSHLSSASMLRNACYADHKNETAPACVTKWRQRKSKSTTVPPHTRARTKICAGR